MPLQNLLCFVFDRSDKIVSWAPRFEALKIGGDERYFRVIEQRQIVHPNLENLDITVLPCGDNAPLRRLSVKRAIGRVATGGENESHAH
jgi:hypothetical protein